VDDGTIGFLTKRRHSFMQLFAFFMQSGVEGAMFFWITSVMQEARGLDVSASGMHPTAFFAAIVAGRIIFGVLAKYMSNTAIIRVGLGLAVIGLGTIMFVSSPAATFLAGFGFAPVFPTLMHATKSRFAPEALNKLVGYQIAAAGAGVAIISPTVGLVLGNVSLEALFPIAIGLAVVVFVINEYLHRSAKANAICPGIKG